MRVIQNPPSREPSNVTGRNMLVDIAARKTGHTGAVESEAIEAAFAVWRSDVLFVLQQLHENFIHAVRDDQRTIAQLASVGATLFSSGNHSLLTVSLGCGGSACFAESQTAAPFFVPQVAREFTSIATEIP